MFGLTLKEFILLVIIIVVVAGIVLSVTKDALKVVICVIICALLFSGFTWLPKKIQEWTGSNKEPDDVNETVNLVKDEAGNLFNIDFDEIDNGIEKTKEAGNKVKEFAKEEAPSWLDALKSLWGKITGTPSNTD